MTLPRPVSLELAELVAQRLRAIGDPTRIRLLDALRDGERSVLQLTEALGCSQQNVSKHLGVLLGAGILTRRKEGTSAFYAVADPTVFELCDIVCGGLRARLRGVASVVETTA